MNFCSNAQNIAMHYQQLSLIFLLGWIATIGAFIAMSALAVHAVMKYRQAMHALTRANRKILAMATKIEILQEVE